MILAGSSLIGLLVELVVAAIVVYAIYLFLGMLSLPSPIKTIVLLIVAAIALIFLANLFGIKV